MSLKEFICTELTYHPISNTSCRIDSSLVFPPNSDIQLIGRERASWYQDNHALISWTGKSESPMIVIQGTYLPMFYSREVSNYLFIGPSKVTVKHLTLLGNNIADGILITNPDQVFFFLIFIPHLSFIFCFVL